jgi:acetyl-CoA acetyltransferase family protein
VASAAQAIRAGEGDIFIAGGVESMTRAPYIQLKSGSAWNRTAPAMADSTVGWRFTNPVMPKEWTISLGETAEKVAKQYGISRQEQDEFAAVSQERAQAAIKAGHFRDEIAPVALKGKDGTRMFEEDEYPRAGVTVESLAGLKPAFVKDGTVTAGSSSGINDGAAAVAVLRDSEAASLGLAPMARIVASAVAGVDPSVMGLGPIPATRKALARAGLTLEDIDLIELNEAFAAQGLACIKELGMDQSKVNIYGGAIALGHPLGCSGARLIATLSHALKRTGGRYGLATMCIGVGQGIAMIIENVRSDK